VLFVAVLAIVAYVRRAYGDDASDDRDEGTEPDGSGGLDA